MTYKHKDLLGLRELSKDEILYFLDSAVKFKELNLKSVKKSDALRGKTVINAFFENSTRTRISFETAAKRLGADAINFSASQSSTKKGETLIDTIHNMEAMKTDIFVVRHECSGSAKFIADNSDASIVNAGDGLGEHPTQGLLDLFTIREHKGKLEGLNVAIIGDIEHSRVARSDIFAMKKFGINVKLFGPAMMMPNRADVFECEIAKNMEDAVRDSDAIIMLRVQLERQGLSTPFPSNREYSKFFGLNKKRLELANYPLVMHPGPINRGVELNSDVADGKCSLVLNQVENGVAIRMAVLDILNKNRENL
ncbi:aspartate carbamoyltransferase catalytic subunit [Campylobacter corcagiensis]|uniref:Aspartate carbamoyltransferase n=1 Tax=Campylobacter corcagiensis TaxID=1448857 RepID=A0A7M1LGM6_9BACT|nr:aspartate carbamoyltransferase catalytic subunit [Campylobacter corcagiensis]QKF65218.1 aspartate carbamoyltransferase, catalytic subunit [Campylobacter corcagiensis]QOQ86645.1 aspartate carbamoyltransferase catalytic subunit [Campylobacter corcagiensis]